MRTFRIAKLKYRGLSITSTLKICLENKKFQKEHNEPYFLLTASVYIVGLSDINKQLQNLQIYNYAQILLVQISSSCKLLTWP